jgi:alpha-L-fucosidase 2
MHPPFQIDGNFGYTAGIAEMLIQSHEGNIIRLLPALPSAWETGHIEGLKGRGGVVVDMYWSNGTLDKAVIKADKPGVFELAYQDMIIPIELTQGEEYSYLTEDSRK